MRVREVVKAIGERLPVDLVSGQDNVGLIVGNYDDECEKLMIAYELDADVISEASTAGSNFIVTYHTPLFKPAKSLVSSHARPDYLLEASRCGLNVFAVHTALDVVKAGLNFDLAKRIGLNGIKFLAPLSNTLYKLVVFVPAPNLEAVKRAMAESGAGRIGNYSECSFSSNGKGTFLPGEGASPYIGAVNKREVVEEARLEMLVEKNLLSRVLRTMFDAHPYEEVAYDVYPLVNESPNFGFGAVGELEEPRSITDFVAAVKNLLGIEHVKLSHLPDKKIKKVTVCAGAGVPFYNDAVREGADIFLTGDVKHHDFRAAHLTSTILADATHIGTEKFAANLIHEIIGGVFEDRTAVRLSKHQHQNAVFV